MRKMAFIGLLLLIAFSVQAQNSNQQFRSMTHDGQERSYWLFVPDGEVSQLMIVLHPFGSSGRAMEVITGLDEIAGAEGFAVVYPNALTYYWDEGRSNFEVGPDDIAIDDVGFMAALADSLTAELGIASDEVYLTGMGSGGGLAYLTACTLPERFKSVAVVSTLIWVYQAFSCPETQTVPINLLMIWGDQNEFYTFEGSELRDDTQSRFIYGVERTTNFWLARNACEPENRPQSASNIALYACGAETTTAFVTIEGGGNNWARVADYQLNRSVLDASQIITHFFKGDDWERYAGQDERMTEIPRSWILYIPNSYDSSAPVPLLLSLHGRTSNGSAQAYISDFNRIAEREGFIAVYPDGLGNQWNYIRDVFGGDGIGDYDDDAFLAALIDDLSLDLNIDSSRVYVTGYSNGGFMTQRLACTQQDRYAAFASVAATGPVGLPELCEGKAPEPILYIHGTADRIVPWDGQYDESGQFYISAPMSRTIGFWAGHNGCPTELDITDIPQSDSTTQTRILDVVGCPETAPIEVYMVIGGGHNWHGVRESDPILGTSSQDFNASEVIWDFLSRFHLAEN